MRYVSEKDLDCKNICCDQYTKCKDCKLLIPFCCRFTVPNCFGKVTIKSDEKQIFYKSCLYYFVDDNPCIKKVSPAEDCPKVKIKLYPVKVAGCIPYVANVKVASEFVCTRTATGGTTNFKYPEKGERLTLTCKDTICVNQIIGYVTDPNDVNVSCGEHIPCECIKVSFFAGPTDCATGKEDPDGKVIEFRGNFKLKELQPTSDC